jgi:uncharacterized protein (TIGR00255 family)
MIQSMTGFGAAAGEVEGVEFAIEVRSVNNRYLKAVVRLPEGLSALEGDIDKLLRSRVQRGTVTLAVQMRLPDEQAAARINTAVVSDYLDQLRPLEVEGNPVLRVDLAGLLALPGACEPPALDELLARTRDGLLGLVGEALDALVAMRQEEGRALAADLLANGDAIESNLAAVSEKAPQVVVDYQTRLTQRVSELTQAGNVRIDEDQLAREVAIFAERCDVAEEITRLTGHLQQFRETVSLGEPSGRKLDFIAQEMLREANTIASKASDSEVARCVVDIKTGIDRIKEQVQNVE